MKFWTKSLMARLVSYFLLLSLLIVSLVGYVALVRARETLKQSIYERLSVAATLKEKELDRWISDRSQDVLLIARASEFRDQAEILLAYEESQPEYQIAYDSLSDYLASVSAYRPDLEEIFLLTDVGGKIILSTNKSREGEYRVTDTYFTQGRLGTYVQNVYPSPVTGDPTMTIATPWFSSSGQRMGVLAAHLDLERLDRIILERTGLGVSGETYLVDKYNVFVSEARFGKRGFPRGVHTQGIDNALKGINSSGLYLNYQDTPVIGVYRWIEDRELALLAEINQVEAFAPAQQLAWTIVLVGLTSAGILTIGVYVLARQVTRPILAIADTASLVAAGDLSQTAPIFTEDEVGVLAHAFNQMTGQLRDLVTTLGQRVAERTSELERRATHMQAAAEVGHAVAAVRNLDELLSQVTHLISERFDFYHVGIFLLDEAGEYAALRATNSEGGQQMLAQGHRLRVGRQGIVGYVAHTGEPRIALDVDRDWVHFRNPYLPHTRSEMALPLIAGNQLLGALDIQSSREAAFTQQDIAALQMLADQVAVAIENARLFEELQSSFREINTLYRKYSQEAWSRMVAGDRATGFEYDRLQVIPMSHYLPSDVVARLQAGRVVTLESTENGHSPNHSTLVAPIMLRNQLIGAIGFEDSNPDRQWSTEEIAVIEAVTNQVALTLENARLLEEAQTRAAREQVVGDITNKMQRASDMDALMQQAIQELQSALNASYAVVQLGTADELLAQPDGDS